MHGYSRQFHEFRVLILLERADATTPLLELKILRNLMDLYTDYISERGEWITHKLKLFRGHTRSAAHAQIQEQDVVIDELIPEWIEIRSTGQGGLVSACFPLDERPITLELLGRKNLVGFSLCFFGEEVRTQWGRKGCLLRDNTGASTNARVNSRTSCRRVRDQPPARFLRAHLDSRVGNWSTHKRPLAQLRFSKYANL